MSSELGASRTRSAWFAGGPDGGSVVDCWLVCTSVVVDIDVDGREPEADMGGVRRREDVPKSAAQDGIKDCG